MIACGTGKCHGNPTWLTCGMATDRLGRSCGAMGSAEAAMRLRLLGMSAMVCSAMQAQDAGPGRVDAFPLHEGGLAIRRHVEAGKPFTVAGPRGVLLGQQEGTFEA